MRRITEKEDDITKKTNSMLLKAVSLSITIINSVTLTSCGDVSDSSRSDVSLPLADSSSVSNESDSSRSDVLLSLADSSSVSNESAREYFKLSDRNPEDYEFSGTVMVYDKQTHSDIRYSGEISDNGTIEDLWNFITVIENQQPCEFDGNNSVGGGITNAVLTLTDKQTGEQYTIRDGIFYENPEVDGGPEVLIINGISYGGNNYICYNRVYGNDNESFEDDFTGNTLYTIICEGIVKDEKIISQDG